MGMLNSTRAALLVLGVIGLWWSTTVLPIFRFAGPARSATERIMADDRFKRGTLGEIWAQIESEPKNTFVKSTLPRARALIHLAVAEEAMQRRRPDEADRETAAADSDLKASLALNPTDSFLWLILYSTETARRGFDPKSIDFLDQSYATGPREGWIALRRNPAALAIFAQLRETIQDGVVAEFAQMVDSEFIEAAAFSFTGAGWTNRERLLASLKSVNIVSRRYLAKQLSKDSVRVNIPGIDDDERPWR